MFFLKLKKNKQKKLLFFQKKLRFIYVHHYCNHLFENAKLRRDKNKNNEIKIITP